jgi:dTDP-4-amino-4,6-dideoxygalactose transaminase
MHTSIEVKFLDLSLCENERSQILSSIDSILKSGKLVLGPEVSKLEKSIAEYANRLYCVGVNSGSSALYLALRALDISVGDEVITSSLSWIATANSIALTGATPVFSDIEKDLNMDIHSIERLITKKTKAVLAVDYTGRLADAKALSALCKHYSLDLIEDGSQSFGACRDGIRCGEYGVVSAISHNAMKVFSSIGEAGSILTNDQELCNRLESLRYNGTVNKEFLAEPSINARMDTIQAAVLGIRLRKVDSIVARRNRNADLYDQLVLSSSVVKPQRRPNQTHALYTYTILADRRDELMDYLLSYNIETKIQHPVLMPHQKPYLQCMSETRVAKELSNKYLCLPIHEKLTEDQIAYVSEKINEFYT